MTDDELWRKAVERGRRLLALMRMDQATLEMQPGPKKPKFVDASSIGDHGWVCEIHNEPYDVQECFRNVYDSAEGLEASLETEENRRFKYDFSSKKDNGDYEFVINRTLGIIQALSLYSPLHAENDTGEPNPELHRWSDFAYFAWLEVARTGALGFSDYPLYVTMNNVKNDETVKVLNMALKPRNYDTDDWDSGNMSEEVPWPGEEFSIEDRSEEGLAILGSALGAGVAWLLIDRKKEFGKLRVKTVNIFTHEEDYSLVFDIGPV